MEEQKRIIQGYIPTVIKNSYEKFFVKFEGGLTKDFMQGQCLKSKDEALQIASKNCNDDDTASVSIVNGLCQLID